MSEEDTKNEVVSDPWEGIAPVEELPHWTQKLQFKFHKNGGRTTLATELNVHRALVTCPSFKGMFAHDVRRAAPVLLRRPPWETDDGNDRPWRVRPVRDEDVGMVRSLLAGPIDTSVHHSPGIDCLIKTQTIEVGIALAARERMIDPVRDYLRSVTGKWDGVERVETLPTKYLGAKATPATRAMFRKWMISAYWRAMRPGVQADHMIIFEGGQGIGKSTFLRTLFGQDNHSEDFPNIHAKDAPMHLATAWCVESAEMARMSKAEVLDLKKFLSQTVDSYRKPYGRQMTEQLRSVVFAATTNEEHYLSDDTGERRFWPIVCAKEFRYEKQGLAEERDQVWAEVVHLAETGEKWWFDPSDAKDAVALSELASLHSLKTQENALESYITRTLVMNGSPKEIRVQQVLDWLEIRPEDAQRHVKRIGIALRKNGYTAERAGSARVWRKLDPMEMNPIEENDVL